MRRWLTILLLMLLPAQLTWAAAASYCQHETGNQAAHLGHHEHQHQGAKAKAVAGSERSGATVDLGALDDDCSVCHLSAVAPIAGSPFVSTVLHATTTALSPLAAFESHIPRVPQRPDRVLAV